MELDTEAWERRIFEMLAGKLAGCPFTPLEIARGSAFLTAWTTEQGHPPTPSAKDVEQGPKIRLIQALMRACRDPGAETMDCYATGVCLGYNQRMPRTPAVFAAKEKWRLKFETDTVATEECSPNYSSARERQKVLEEKIVADVKAKRMVEMDYGTAKQKF